MVRGVQEGFRKGWLEVGYTELLVHLGELEGVPQRTV